MISVMRFSKFHRSIRQLSTHVLAVILGVVLTVSTLRVSPSQAETLSPNLISATPQIVAQQTEKATIAPNSFVTTAVNRVGSAVVRIDTERTVTRRLDPIFEDPFFRRFLAKTYPSNYQLSVYRVWDRV